MKINLVIVFSLLSYCTFGQIINDESYKNLEFLEFKTDLIDCVLKKDVKRLKTFLADTVYESNNGCGYPGCSKSDFIKFHFEEDKESSRIYWNRMLSTIRYGFAMKVDEYPNNIVPHGKNVFQAPSYLKAIDTQNELIVLGENVNIRKSPGFESEIIGHCSYEVFKCDCNILSSNDNTHVEADGIFWIEIKLINNKVGYVSSELTSYEIRKEMTIAKVKGKWKIISWSHGPGC